MHNLVCTTTRTSDKHSLALCFPTLSVSRDGNVRGICQARFEEEVVRPSTDASSSLGLLRLAWKQEDGSRGDKRPRNFCGELISSIYARGIEIASTKQTHNNISPNLAPLPCSLLVKAGRGLHELLAVRSSGSIVAALDEVDSDGDANFCSSWPWAIFFCVSSEPHLLRPCLLRSSMSMSGSN